MEPGETLTVTVEASPTDRFRGVAVLSPLASDFKTAPPFVFTLEIPPDAPLGPQPLTAFIGLGKDDSVKSTITIHVETVAPVQMIRVRSRTVGRPASVALIAGVTEQRLKVEGTFTDGTTRDISKSREITYVSSNPQVATVTPEGLVEAVEPGTTTITVTYKDKSTTVPVTVKFRKLTVPLDIKPDDRRNTINLDSGGHVRVAILSTPTFAATTVNTPTVRFGPGQAPPLAGDDDEDDEEEDREGRRKHTGTRGKPKHHLEDTNDDGRPDLLLQFSIPATGLTCADTQATLSGVTFSGDRMSGSDAIRVVGKACR
ncbi:MAG: Ig-like domain-containing protein [candidate division NC10 bacterium]|nr:Ig-like domain-containing protein [candidate division NC10 bacterium]